MKTKAEQSEAFKTVHDYNAYIHHFKQQYFIFSSSAGENDGFLQYADTFVIDNQQCQASMQDPDYIIADSHICAYDGVSAACTVSKQSRRQV